MPLLIRSEQPSDHADIFAVNAAAFPTDAEARLVDRLRSDGFVRCSLVAEMEGRIVGHILFSELQITNGAPPSNTNILGLSLAPLAVLPATQRQGIGSELVRRGLEKCRLQGHRIVIVLGAPAFYRRFGFSGELAKKTELSLCR